MSYSVNAILHHRKDSRDNTQKVQILVIYDRCKAIYPTDFKVLSTQFNKGTITNHPNEKLINHNIKSKIIDIETRILKSINKGVEINKSNLASIITGKVVSTDLFTDFVDDLIKKYALKYSKGTLAHYNVLKGKVDTYRPDLRLSAIDLHFLQEFEKHLREPDEDGNSLDHNTIQSNMKAFKGMLHKAADLGLIEKAQFEKYRVPLYIQKIPEYLNEEEVDSIFKIAELLPNGGLKRAGYYFLLSCYTGFRISDAMAFNYDKMVQGGNITLRAKKNKQIVSIPVYPKLQKVLDFVKDNPVDLKEPVIRRYLGNICSMAGIKKHVKFHTARHSFAVMLRSKGFDRQETSELLGDSEEVAAVYDVISNPHLAKKVRDRLG